MSSKDEETLTREERDFLEHRKGGGGGSASFRKQQQRPPSRPSPPRPRPSVDEQHPPTFQEIGHMLFQRAFFDLTGNVTPAPGVQGKVIHPQLEGCMSASAVNQVFQNIPHGLSDMAASFLQLVTGGGGAAPNSSGASEPTERPTNNKPRGMTFRLEEEEDHYEEEEEEEEKVVHAGTTKR